MRILLRTILALAVGLALFHFPEPQEASFSFVVTADMRYFAGEGSYNTSSYYRGAVESILATGQGAFMISPGDIDPPAGVRWTIDQVLGSDYRWYPLPGNHETETPEDMAWLRAYNYGAVNPGPAACPETTYSFDYSNAHFVLLNEYCDSGGDTATGGDIPDYLYNWLAADLAATTKPHIFVAGHEPITAVADMDNGRLRHTEDNLGIHPENASRFLLLLDRYDAIYLCGHTHDASVIPVGGIWQIDVGHARGLGDTGARSTYVRITVYQDSVHYDI